MPSKNKKKGKKKGGSPSNAKKSGGNSSAAGELKDNGDAVSDPVPSSSQIYDNELGAIYFSPLGFICLPYSFPLVCMHSIF